jgi:hypothetical protein
LQELPEEVRDLPPVDLPPLPTLNLPMPMPANNNPGNNSKGPSEAELAAMRRAKQDKILQVWRYTVPRRESCRTSQMGSPRGE